MEYETSFDFYIEDVKHGGEIHQDKDTKDRIIVINGDFMIAKIQLNETQFQDLDEILNLVTKFYVSKGFKSKDKGIARDIKFDRIEIGIDETTKTFVQNKIANLEEKHNVYVLFKEVSDSKISVYGLAYIHEEDRENFIAELRN